MKESYALALHTSAFACSVCAGTIVAKGVILGSADEFLAETCF